MPPSTAVIRWQPPADRPEEIARRAAKKAKDERLARMHEAQDEAKTALAEARVKTFKTRVTILTIVEREMEKYLRMSQDPDFANTIAPLSPDMVLKLAEWASKEDRLDLGKSTENIAHTVESRVDFSRLTQQERDAWRGLAIKAGARDDEGD
jgi:vacuolar-type H+-ATPase subunit E/Vma4